MHLPGGFVGAAMYPLACLRVAPVHSISASKGKERDRARLIYFVGKDRRHDVWPGKAVIRMPSAM